MNIECSDFEWSDNPGAYEAQLIRRCGNPYFEESQQFVTVEELLEARKIDEADFQLASKRLERFSRGITELLSGSVVVSGQILDLRERLEELIYFSMGVGGSAYGVASSGIEIRNFLLTSLRELLEDAGDQESLRALDSANKYYSKYYSKFRVPVVAQMLRERSPIRDDATIATLLSEDAEDIRIALSVLPKDGRVIIINGALELIKRALDQGFVETDIEEKVAVLVSYLD
jgi:hypothetical protein